MDKLEYKKRGQVSDKWNIKGANMKKFEKVLELQEQGVPREEIYKICEWSSLDSLTRAMRKNGYIYDKIKAEYVQGTEVCQVSANDDKRADVAVIPNDTMIDLKTDKLKGKVIDLANNHEEIMKMLAWYKAYGGQVSPNATEVIEVINKGIHIELPKVESIKTSIRVNKSIWEQFGLFANNHSEFIKGDLLAQALKEYMEKHRE